MRGRFVWRAALVGALMGGALAACGDDDEEATTDTTAAGSEGGGSGDNTRRVEMVDSGYKVSGELKSGLATIESTNSGDEWHMAGFGKLKAGKTLGELVTALQNAGGGEGGPAQGGGATETTAAGATLRAAGQETTTTTAAEGGGEEGDPFAEFIEEELGSPGHILQPGQTQALTVDLDPGSYVMLCFLPTEGEGTPHFAKGMVGGFEVAEEATDAAAPEADATIKLGDDAEPTGVPTDWRPASTPSPSPPRARPARTSSSASWTRARSSRRSTSTSRARRASSRRPVRPRATPTRHPGRSWPARSRSGPARPST